MNYWSKLASLLLLTIGGASQAAPNLWHARSANNELIILGSIHLGDDSIYPLPSLYQQHLESSERLVVETDINAISKQDRALIASLTTQTDGSLLSEQLSAELMNNLSKQTQALGISSARFENFQAWYVALNLTQLKMNQLGYDAQLGIDQHFLQRAQDLSLPIYSLETVSEQFTALSVLREGQLELLKQTLEQLPNLDQDFSQLIALWKAGKEQQLFDLLSSDAMFDNEDQGVLQSLLYERNYNWIEQLLTLSGKSFVVVGAMHLQSEQGLLALLEAQGYELESLDSE
ncbi:TraB/GumN family protein [Alginatibacterium sediminis]|uniref:TraB/GumN family protein n=1 Tax=Alginatibacterium sediminis TaxID=2164068 RepID=A0A420E5S7_9ALTE|nr:TraB/GumN family protein [Alginatibacterium sediminis]RKF13154.1 TraB/GumN family protein [Alginatibacterium sediminis]